MESLLIKLKKPPGKHNLKSLSQCYSRFTADFCLAGTTEKKVLKIMQNIDNSKAAGEDKLSTRHFCLLNLLRNPH